MAKRHAAARSGGAEKGGRRGGRGWALPAAALLAWVGACAAAGRVAEARRAEVERVRTNLLYRATFVAHDLLVTGRPHQEAAQALVAAWDDLHAGPYLLRPVALARFAWAGRELQH